jgi:peptidoglycan/LPS O-acetylase OafA/YrhL
MPHFWSLAVEEQFYMLWPLLLWRLTVRDIWVVCLLMVAFTPMLRLLLIVLGAPPEALYEFTICRMDALAAGAALAVWIQDRRTPAERGLPVRPPRTHGALVLGLVLLVVTAVVSRGFQRLGEIPQVIGYTLLAASFTALTAWAVLEDQRRRLTRQPGSGLSGVLRSPVLRSFGKYSYAIYVFHKPLHDHVGLPLLQRLTGHAETTSTGLAIGYFLAATLVTWGVGWLSWQLFERHFMALKDRFARPAPAPVDNDAPTALDRALAEASRHGGPVVHGTVTAAQRRNFRPRAAKGRGLLRGNPAPRR